MKKLLHHLAIIYASRLLLFTLMLSSVSLFSQTRYVSQVFSQVNVTADTTYGTNMTILMVTPTPESLKMDIYEPAGDTSLSRPLVILCHSGAFLPPIINGSPFGSRKDSSVVEICRRLAKSGYVAVAMSNRLGWNPVSVDLTVRLSSGMNAGYRGVQDVLTCIRFFKAYVANGGNGFRVDTTRIVVGGVGTGGYTSLAAAYFDKYVELTAPKFLNYNSNPPEPYIDTLMSGNFEGTTAAPLNIPNHVGHLSDFHLVFNIGGAIMDSTWIELDDMPSVSFHCIKDPIDNYKYGGGVGIPPPPFAIQNYLGFSGSYIVASRSNDLDNNDIFHTSDLKAIETGPFTVAADTNNDGFEGLFPFDIPTPNKTSSCLAPNSHPHPDEASPWSWWNEAWYIAEANAIGQPGTAMNCIALTENPNDPARSRIYIDSIIGYLLPRIVCALDLPGCIPDTATGLQISDLQTVRVYPNPSHGEVVIDLSETGISSFDIELYDILGNLVFIESGITSQHYGLLQNQLSSGIYNLVVRTRELVSTHKLVFH